MNFYFWRRVMLFILLLPNEDYNLAKKHTGVSLEHDYGSYFYVVWLEKDVNFMTAVLEVQMIQYSLLKAFLTHPNLTITNRTALLQRNLTTCLLIFVV